MLAVCWYGLAVFCFWDSGASPVGELGVLITQLGDEDFHVRRAAERALVNRGAEALGPLRNASERHADAEVRRRALAALERLDPGHWARSQLETQRRHLLSEIRTIQGVDVVPWSRSVENPFVHLTEAGKARLRVGGVDPERLGRRPARLLTGIHTGADAKHFVNHDPELLLILGPNFHTHGALHSAGPILVAGNAVCKGLLKSADTIWFVEQALGVGDTVGAPVIVEEGSRMAATPLADDVWLGRYGWCRPRDFPRFLDSPSPKK